MTSLYQMVSELNDDRKIIEQQTIDSDEILKKQSKLISKVKKSLDVFSEKINNLDIDGFVEAGNDYIHILNSMKYEILDSKILIPKIMKRSDFISEQRYKEYKTEFLDYVLDFDSVDTKITNQHVKSDLVIKSSSKNYISIRPCRGVSVSYHTGSALITATGAIFIAVPHVGDMSIFGSAESYLYKTMFTVVGAAMIDLGLHFNGTTLFSPHRILSESLTEKKGAIIKTIHELDNKNLLI